MAQDKLKLSRNIRPYGVMPELQDSRTQDVPDIPKELKNERVDYDQVEEQTEFRKTEDHSQETDRAQDNFKDLGKGRDNCNLKQLPQPNVCPEDRESVKNQDPRPKDPFDCAKRYVRKEALGRVSTALLDQSQNGGVLIDPAYDRYAQGNSFGFTNKSKGGFGETVVWENKETNKFIVEKQLPKERLNINEVIAPIALEHVNIVQLFGVLQANINGCLIIRLIMEFAGLPLITYVAKYSPVADEIFDSLCFQGYRVLEYIHRPGWIHFDIKPENVCVKIIGGKPVLKLVDFGSAKKPYQPLMGHLGWTPEYLPSESCRYYLQLLKLSDFNIKENEITDKVDVFAMTLTLLYIKTGSHLLKDLVAGATICTREKYGYRIDLLRKMAHEGEKCLKPLLQKMPLHGKMRLVMDKTLCPVNKRLSAHEILQILEDRSPISETTEIVSVKNSGENVTKAAPKHHITNQKLRGRLLEGDKHFQPDKVGAGPSMKEITGDETRLNTLKESPPNQSNPDVEKMDGLDGEELNDGENQHREGNLPYLDQLFSDI